MIMKASDIAIPTFLGIGKKNELEQHGRFNTAISGVPYTSDVSDSIQDPELKLNGRCEQFDLTKSEDRERYADLCARFLTPCGCEKLWEQRVPKTDGGMIVYVAYTELSKLSYNTAIEVNDKEDK